MAVWTQTDVDVLKAAIKAGTTSVSYNGRAMTYRSLSEMMTLLRLMQDEVAGVTPDRSAAVRAATFTRV